MEKLYSKKYLIAKASFCFVLPLAHQLFTSGSLVLSLEWLFLSVVLMGCLYTIPFWMTVSFLYRHHVSGIGRYILLDLGTCFAPAVISSILYEAYSLMAHPSVLTGMYTLLISIILLLISGIFWLLYKIVGKHNRP